MKRLLHSLIVLAVVVSALEVLYAISASDDFNRANGGLGANWTHQSGIAALVIESNHVREGTGGDTEQEFYNSGSWSGDQESSVTCTWNDTTYCGPSVRASATGGSRNNYYFICDNGSGQCFLLKTVSGTETTISTSFTAPASGSVVKLRATGTSPATLQVYDDGVDISTTSCSGVPCTDSSVTGGNPGMVFLGGAGASFLDNWVGADVGGGTTTCTRSLLGVGCDVEELWSAFWTWIMPVMPGRVAHAF